MTQPTAALSDPLASVRDALERAGCDPRGSDRDFTARCPAHDDRTPSLHVSEGADGRALLCCFAGCPNGSVVGALGLTLADLFPSDPLGGPHWPRPMHDRYIALAGRADESSAEHAHDRARSRDADTLLHALVQVARNGREFSASLAFTCPWCETGHAWVRRNRNGLVADCDAGCAEHEVLEALAGTTLEQAA
jgi:hypothetical protein